MGSEKDSSYEKPGNDIMEEQVSIDMSVSNKSNS